MNTLFKNINIIDGTGVPAFRGDVMCKDGKLTFKDASPDEVIEGAGLTLCPSFIDAHSHGDLMLGSDFSALSKLSQGITTQIGGNCGFSMWPENPVDAICPYPDMPPKQALDSFEDYLQYAAKREQRLNTRFFIGHGSLRHFVMGDDAGKPSKAQLARMCAMLKDAVNAGALGMSTGLVYAPGCFADEAELTALLRAAASVGGSYATHVRNEADFVEQAEEEAVRLAKAAGLPLFISHFKAAGRQNWGKPARILARFDEENAHGMRITADYYPYLAGMTSLNVSIPPHFKKDGAAALVRYLNDPAAVEEMRRDMSERGDYENYILNSGGFDGVMVSSCPKFHAAEGMRITDYARELGIDPFDAYISILRKNDGLGLGVYFHMCEEDLLNIASWTYSVLGTDALLGKPTENGHPRAFGCFPYAIEYLVREKHMFTPEAMIRRMSGLTAERFGLNQKGRIAEGMDADVVLLDIEKLHANATFANSNQLTNGITGVWNGGKRVYWEGKLVESDTP